MLNPSTAYEYWMFNNIPIEYVMNHNVSDGKITLNCYTEGDNLNDPRVIIKRWQDYEAQQVSRLITLGNVQIQTSKPTYTLTNQLQSFKASLDSVTFNEDSYSNDIILFDLGFTIGDSFFLDKYGKKYMTGYGYNSLLYQQYLDEEIVTSNLGTELGRVSITEAYPITRVDVYGYGLGKTSYVDVNGVRKYWHYLEGDGIEKLIFDIDYVNNVVITSPNYLNPPSNYRYFGSKITGIATFYNENVDLIRSAIEGM